MPSKKRSEEEEDSLQGYCRSKQWPRERKAQEEDGGEEREEQVENDEQDEDEDSDASDDADPKDLPEYLEVKLTEIRKDVQCPICLGIIKKTRTVMECLHRFCRECIDKSMRLGNNECPACRTHCASRRSLRDDPRFDAIIQCLYPDIAKYEEEELAFHEDEKNRNKQIQDSIAQIFQRQSEALVKRRRKGKEPTIAKSRSTRTNNQSPYSKRKRNCSGSDENPEEDEIVNTTKDSCSTDEDESRTKRRYVKKRKSMHAEVAENETAASKGKNMEGLAWGRGGTRSNSRYGSVVGGASKNGTRSSSRLSKLADYLQSLQDNNGDDEYLADEVSEQEEEPEEEEAEEDEKEEDEENKAVNEITEHTEEEELKAAINNIDNSASIPMLDVLVSQCEQVAAQESLG